MPARRDGNSPERTIAIGDIHGCAAALSALLAAIRPRRGDTLVTLGDYVNRGPDSAGAIRRLLELARACTLVPLLGNHDQALLDAIDGRIPLDELLAIGGRSTLHSYGTDDPRRIPADHVDFLRGLRLYHETPTCFFVHASYEPLLPLDRQPTQVLLDRSLRDFVPGPHASGKTAIVGHTSQKNGQVLDLGHLVCLDTGCAHGGRLTALEVVSRQQWQIACPGRLV